MTNTKSMAIDYISICIIYTMYIHNQYVQCIHNQRYDQGRNFDKKKTWVC